MLNTDILDILFTTQDRYHDLLWSLKSENEVKRTIPALQPVAVILTGEGGYEGGRAHAYVFPLPDGTLIRLRNNANNTPNYESATAVPSTHPAAKAYAEKREHFIEITVADEGDIGPRANPADVEKLKERLEADLERGRRELAQERHLKL